ncbi:MAG: hypothetical protein ACFFEK_01100 [Candidatus Thorarchaeota archaeon]
MARRVKLSVAKKAVDSTFRKILKYTAEIIASIFLLVIICIPLVFVIPMWLEHIVLGIPRAELVFDPVHLFGFGGAFWLTLFLGLVSFVLGYLFIIRMKAGIVSEVEQEDEEESDEEYEVAEEEEEEAEPEVEEEEIDEIATEEEEEDEEEEEEELTDDELENED